MKIWSQNHGFLEKWRVLDVDVNHGNQDGSMNVVMWTENNGSNQEWQLIGKGSMDSNTPRYQFKGVLVNRYNGKMLRLEKDGGLFTIVDTLYKGSKEEKYYNQHGNFNEYEESDQHMVYTS